MNARSDSVLAAWLALFLFGVYLLSYSGQLYSQDSQSMFSVTESFVKRGDLDTDQMWTLFKARNEIAGDGESYSKYGYGISLLAVPLYALAFAFPALGLVQTTLLSSSVVIALSGALVFLAARRLKYSRGVSLVVALLFGLATPAWVYAKEFWSEPAGLFALLAAFYFLLRFRETAQGWDSAIAGAALGMAVATRVTNAALVPVFAWYGFSSGLRFNGQDRAASSARRGFVLFGLVLALGLISIAGYDMVRYGSPLATGYRADETFDNPLLLGVYGLLFSPGKGLFVYVPFLAALAFSLPVFVQRARREAVLVLAVFAFYLLLFSLWYYWWGGTNWGPRFLVPTLPFLVLAVAPAVELALSKSKPAFTVVFSILCILAFGIELVGISIPALAYRLRMLHVSGNPDWDSIFVPQYSPLVGSFELFRPKLIDFAWMRVVNNAVTIDWLVIALIIVFIVFCAVSLRSWGASEAISNSTLGIASSQKALLAMTGVALALALLSIYRYGDDARFGGGDAYRAALQVVQSEERPQDVLILNNDIYAPFLFNENRARLQWYGLSRDPKQWDEPTRALLTRLSRQYTRFWLAYDDSTGDLPDPTREWLDQSLRKVDTRDFADGVHLALYAADRQP